MAADTLTLTTELEAVNLMLKSIGESPIASLDDPDELNSDAADALNDLRNSNRTIQTSGWHFNKFRRLLTRNGSNEIVLPENTLSVDTIEDCSYINVIDMGGKLYDLFNDRTAFEKDLRVEIILLKAFTDIPQAARNFIIEDAGLRFQAGKLGNESLHRFTQERWVQCRNELKRANNRTRKPNSLTDSYHGQRFLLRERRILS